MKKSFIYIYSLLVLAVSMPSCSAGWLDLEPSIEAPADEAVKSYADAKVVLNGVYSLIKGTSTYRYYYGANMIYYGDVKADDVQSFAESSRSINAYRVAHGATQLVDNMWQIPYKVIFDANLLLENVEAGAVQDATQEQIDDLRGQLLMARALAHFDLLRLYSLPYNVFKDKALGEEYGIPIVKTTQGYFEPRGRNTINETYASILEDLTFAADKMSAANGIGYFNKWAAKGLLARVYLYMGDNANALKLAEEVMTTSPYKLWTTDKYGDAWSTVPNNQSDTEVLFEISITSTEDWTDREGIAYLYNENGYNDAHITKSFYDFLNKEYTNDVRLNTLAAGVKDDKAFSHLFGKKVWVNKYPGKKGESDIRINNVPLLRLSEVYLIASEAALKEGNATKAAQYLNDIILRGNSDATKVTAGDITLDRILQERRVELFGEGHRLFDLLRNDKKVVRYVWAKDKDGKDYKDLGWHLPVLDEKAIEFDKSYYRAILPIPDAEISANSIIEGQQNPGY